MMRILSLLLLITTIAVGQSIPTDSIVRKPGRYYFSARTGMTLCAECEVDGPTTGYINIVQGIRLTPGSRLGIGFGLMSASQRMILPLFGSFKFDLFGKKNKVFFETNYGIGTAIHGQTREERYWTETVNARSYFQPSLGYSINYHDMKIGIHVGMQWLKMESVVSYPSWGWINDFQRGGTPNTTEFKYEVARMMVGMSIGWRD
jgi:hypothetical protein